MAQEWMLLCWDMGRDRVTQKRMLTGGNLAVGSFQVSAEDDVTSDGTAVVMVTAVQKVVRMHTLTALVAAKDLPFTTLQR